MTDQPGGAPPYPGQPDHPGQGSGQDPGQQQPQPTYGAPPPPPPPQYGAPAPPQYGAPAAPTPYGAPQQQYGSYPPGTPPYTGQETQQRGGYSGFAIAAFVCGLVIPILGLLLAIVFGVIALVRISNRGQKGRWLAIAGMTLGVLWVGGVIALGIWAAGNQYSRNDAGAIDKAGSISFGDIRADDCVTIPGLASSNSDINAGDLKGVPCADQHNAQAIFIVPLNESSYPGSSALLNEARDGCAPHFQAFTSQADLRGFYLYPTESVWNDTGGHRAICFVIKSNKSSFTGTVTP